VDYQFIIIFGRNVPHTTGHQMTTYVSILSNVYFCIAWGKQNT